MIRRLIKKIKLRFYPPKSGDVYVGDPFFFFIGKNVEYILHGMRNKYGDPLWCTFPGSTTYRMTIESDAMPYYRCTSEVLAYAKDGSTKRWMKRSQPRRIKKNTFINLILDGKLEKV